MGRKGIRYLFDHFLERFESEVGKVTNTFSTLLCINSLLPKKDYICHKRNPEDVC